MIFTYNVYCPFTAAQRVFAFCAESGRWTLIYLAELPRTRRVSPPDPWGDPVPQNGISSSRSTSSGFSFSADFGRLRKSTFSAMISQP